MMFVFTIITAWSELLSSCLFAVQVCYILHGQSKLGFFYISSYCLNISICYYNLYIIIDFERCIFVDHARFPFAYSHLICVWLFLIHYNDLKGKINKSVSILNWKYVQ